jgi:transposase-like protein
MSQDNGHDGAGAAARFAERAVGERGESGRGARGASGPPPDPELVERPKRRRFSAKYKLEILERADACTRPGEVGELLRREGLYTSHLTYWRRQRKDGALKELGRPRGRKPADRRDREIAELRRRAERAEAELEKAKKVIEIQGNVSALLEQMLSTEGASESGSTER